MGGKEEEEEESHVSPMSPSVPQHEYAANVAQALLGQLEFLQKNCMARTESPRLSMPRGIPAKCDSDYSPSSISSSLVLSEIAQDDISLTVACRMYPSISVAVDLSVVLEYVHTIPGP